MRESEVRTIDTPLERHAVRGVEKLLLRPTEAADVLGLGRSKTYALITSGVIPSITIGQARRIPLDALRAWVAAQQGQQL